MGIFGNKKNPEEELSEIIEKYGLDFQSYDEQKIGSENKKNIKQIATGLNNAKLMGLGAALSGGSGNLVSIAGLLKAIVGQNWIMIRQNELLIRRQKK